MNKYVIGVDGMRCGMCEAHVKETVSKSILVKKIKVTHSRKFIEVFSELNLTKIDFENALNPTGYRVLSFRKEEALKSLFGWK